MRTRYVGTALLLIAASAGSVFGTEIYALGQASTAGFTQGVVTGPTARGWDFQVNSAGVMVNQLGVNAATSASITLTLWDDSTQTALAQVVETTTANAWAFASLTTPVLLNTTDEYSVIGFEDAANSPWYLLNNTPPAAFNPTGVIQYVDTRYSNSGTANTFPTSLLPSPAQYGVTDIGYTLLSTPEPMSLGLVGGGLTLLCVLRRKRLFS
jgi:hypothetical protein